MTRDRRNRNLGNKLSGIKGTNGRMVGRQALRMPIQASVLDRSAGMLISPRTGSVRVIFYG